MQESPFNLAPKHMPLSHNSPVLTASCQMLMAVYRPGGIRWHMHISLTTMFYMPRKCTLIRLCLELASAMSLVGSALPSLHLSPTLSLPFPWPSHVSCLTWDIPHGSFSAMKGLSGSWEWFVGSMWGDSQAFIWEMPSFRSTLQQILRCYLSPQHLGSKHLWTCTPEFSTGAVEQFELKWWQDLGDLCRKLREVWQGLRDGKPTEILWSASTLCSDFIICLVLS